MGSLGILPVQPLGPRGTLLNLYVLWFHKQDMKSSNALSHWGKNQDMKGS